MALGGDGPYLVEVVWSLTGLIHFFLLLRLYTRIVCVAAYGIHDHLYVLTCVLIVAYSSLETVAAYHGYGRNDLDGDAMARSTYFRVIGQTFSLIATGTSKATVGLFLLRIVVERWMQIAIWVTMTVMGVLCVLATIFTWASCTPVAFTWDERIPNGICINTIPLAIGLALWTIVADLFFAILPWVFIWKLNIPKREKIILAGSLSLGIFAAAAGIKRIMAVRGVRDVPVDVVVWSQVETAATLVCVVIPVCRPLWTRRLSKYFKSSKHSSSKGGPYKRQDDDVPPPPPLPRGNGGPAPPPIGLHTFGGGAMPGAKRSSAGSKSRASANIAYLWFGGSKTSQVPGGSGGGGGGTELYRWDDESDVIYLTLEEQQQSRRSSSQVFETNRRDSPTVYHWGSNGSDGADLNRSWIVGEAGNQPSSKVTRATRMT